MTKLLSATELRSILDYMSDHKRSIRIVYQTEGIISRQINKSFEYFEYDESFLYHVHHNDRLSYKLQNVLECEEWKRPRRWSVYVVELNGNPNYLYVGETAHPPELRLAQHNAGQYSSGSGRIFINGARGTLRPDLYAHIPSVSSKEEALMLEKRVYDGLKAARYRVKGGH